MHNNPNFRKSGKLNPKVLLCFFISCLFGSCITKEEVGLAQYFVDNQSVYDIHVRGSYISSVIYPCDSCYIGKNTKILIGHDSEFGHAPNPDQTIHQINIFKNDSLKLTFVPPFSDTVMVKQKGAGKYDYDFILVIKTSYLE